MGGGIIGWVVGLAALVTAVTVIVKSPPFQWLHRKVFGPMWVEAVESAIEPHLSELRSRLDSQDEKLDAVLAEVKNNGGRSLKDRVEQVHEIVVKDQEIDRLQSEGRITE